MKNEQKKSPERKKNSYKVRIKTPNPGFGNWSIIGIDGTGCKCK